jgi:hypothetical protein
MFLGGWVATSTPDMPYTDKFVTVEPSFMFLGGWGYEAFTLTCGITEQHKDNDTALHVAR